MNKITVIFLAVIFLVMSAGDLYLFTFCRQQQGALSSVGVMIDGQQKIAESLKKDLEGLKSRLKTQQDLLDAVRQENSGFKNSVAGLGASVRKLEIDSDRGWQKEFASTLLKLQERVNVLEDGIVRDFVPQVRQDIDQLKSDIDAINALQQPTSSSRTIHSVKP